MGGQRACDAAHGSDAAGLYLFDDGADVGGECVGNLAAGFDGGSPSCVEARAFHRLDFGQAFQV